MHNMWESNFFSKFIMIVIKLPFMVVNYKSSDGTIAYDWSLYYNSLRVAEYLSFDELDLTTL